MRFAVAQLESNLGSKTGPLKRALELFAVQRAIDKVNAVILENHLETCVTTAICGDDLSERQRVITELIDVFETSNKL